MRRILFVLCRNYRSNMKAINILHPSADELDGLLRRLTSFEYYFISRPFKWKKFIPVKYTLFRCTLSYYIY